MRTNHTTFDHGVVGYLEHDQDCDSPLECDDAVKLAILHRNYANPAPACGSTPEEIAQWAKDNAAEWDAYPLYLYDHSGVCYKPAKTEVNPFSCAWDSGRVGSVFVKKIECPDTFATAEIMCEEYTRWCNGDCWGYVVEDENGEQLDSCWGYIGEEYAVEEMRSSAEGYVDDERERHNTEMAADIEASRPDMVLS